MQLRLITLFIGILLSGMIFPSRVFAQTNQGFEIVSTANGLSQGLVNDMLQDKEGFIWAATKGGLNRYDGYTFKTFTTDPQDTNSISSNAVSNLIEDKKGRIWIGTYDAGLNVYDKNSGRFLRITQKAGGLSGNRIVSSMMELPDGRILICPQGATMNIVSLPDYPDSKPVISSLNPPGSREVLGMAKDDKGFIWISCVDGSIFIFNPSSESFELLNDGKTFTGLIEKVGTRISDRVGQAFVETSAVPAQILFQDSTGQLNPGIISTGEDGNLFIGNGHPLNFGIVGSEFYDFSSLKKGSGLKETKVYVAKTSVANQNIKCILLDRSGVLWMGMLGHGLYKYRIGSSRFKSILPKLSIQRLTLLQNGVIYLNGWRTIKTVTSEGIECKNPLEFIIGNSAATNVLQGQNGDYWAYDLPQKKLSRFSSSAKLLATYPEPVNPAPTEQLQPLLEDNQHRIWVCGANGTLAVVEPTTGKLSRFVINSEDGIANSALTQTNAFFQDAAGIFWMGTEHGFARIDFSNGTAEPKVKWFKNIPGNSNSLSYNYVSCFMDDPANNDYLWISTKGGGLNRMQKSTGKFIHYTTKQGLPNDVVYGTLTDKAGDIWGSTNRGLFCMLAGSVKENEQPVFRLFGTTDGLQADEFNTNAFKKLSNGDLVFGGVKGLNIFNPQKILAASYNPGVYITGIQLGNKILTPADNTGVLKETIEYTHAITLSYLQDVVTLEFSSLDFTAPSQNKYRYQLLGIDKEWVESGTRRSATYLHLPSGNYTFKVQGSNSQGIWSDKIAELKISVLPPWWRTWLAYFIYVLIIAFAIRAYFKFSVNRANLKAQLNFEKVEAKRMKEVDTLKTQLYTNITHEFRTPLTVILGMADQVLSKPEENFSNRMNMIKRNGQSLLNLVNEMLDLSKLETGKMSLQLANGEIINFLRYITESFHSLAESQDKGLHFLTDLDVLFVQYDEEKIRQIVVNLLSNALKFTPKKGNIYISISKELQVTDPSKLNITIKVKDTGIGIPEEQLELIFNRFYQLDNTITRTAEGTGIGLSLTKELVRLMNGEIHVKSPASGAIKGSEFIVTLPLRIGAESEMSLSYPLTSEIIKTKTEETITTPVTFQYDIENNNRPLILLVEDNQDVVAYTASCLPDYRLAVGKDGREGIEIASDIIPDLIITDVMMPFVDGFELVQRLRSNENTSHIPIIMLTAKADRESKMEGLKGGVDVYLEKPFNKEELLLRIQKLLELRKTLQQYYMHQVNNSVIAQPEELIITPVKSEDVFVAKVREVVEENLANSNFTVEDLCKKVFMSHSQLHRKLEALTGCSPNRFIRIIRLNKSQELLTDMTVSIGSVALDSGYNDPGYFARVFKQEFGITPQEWRTKRASFK